MAVLPTCMSVRHMCAVPVDCRGQKMVSAPLELESQTPCESWKSSRCPQLLSHLASTLK